jgi:nucleoside-diphosphate-sugar epimerase
MPELPLSKVFITGALGFIGGAIAARLRSDGVQVAGVDARADPALGVLAGDVSRPGPWQEHAAGCDAVIHTAAIVSFRAGLEDFHRVNVLGTRNALDAGISAGAGRFIQLSSVTVFGNDFPDGVVEEHPVRLLGVPYVDTKIAGEQIVLQAHAAGEMQVTVIRPGDVYGPGSRPWLLTPLQEIQRGRLVLPAGGKGIHSPVYVDDLVEGIIAAVKAPAAAGQVITLSGGEGVSTGEYFGRIAWMAGRPRVRTAPTSVLLALTGAQAATERLLSRSSEINPAAVRYMTRRGTYSISRARRILGYEPRVDLEEGMRRSEAWLSESGLLSGHIT